MNRKTYPVQGAGLGYRRALMGPLSDLAPGKIDFMEVAPENWIGLGGRLGKQFRSMTESYPFVCHGLSLSLGGPSPIDVDFVEDVKAFIKTHNIRCYTEHLSYCSDDGHLYDLMPIPFTEEAVKYVASRIRQVQDILEQKIAVENVSAYACPGQEMSEIDFLNAVIEEADCGLHLDVNNIYVNSVNHNYDPYDFLSKIPADRIFYIHVAGHYTESDSLLVDTHGTKVIDPVWDILNKTYELYGVIPTLLERDFNFPPLSELLDEVQQIRERQNIWRFQEAL